jgi:uncharacterized protein (TIGR02268 family)
VAPPHELRVARGVVTVLRFNAQLNRDAIEVEGRGTRIKVDAGDSSIILEPLIDLGPTERLMLSVPFADGQRAVFVLVSHASEVDTRIDVVRRAQTAEACRAELAETEARCSKISPARFARAGWLTDRGVVAQRIHDCFGDTRMAGLVCDEGMAYRAEEWALVVLKIRNESKEHPWAPREVTLRGVKSGVLLMIRAVEVEPARIAPGEVGRVFVEIEPPRTDETFVLELGERARNFKVPNVDFSSRKENKR